MRNYLMSVAIFMLVSIGYSQTLSQHEYVKEKASKQLFQDFEKAEIQSVETVSRSLETVFFENFEGGAFPPTGWTNTNLSGGSVWMRFLGGGFNGSNAATNGGKSTTADRDAWLISTGISLNVGSVYAINFYLNMPGDSSNEDYDSFEAIISQTATPEGMADGEIIVSRIAEPTQFFRWELIEYRFVPSVTGTYYIGFHAFTPQNCGEFITIDNVRVERLLDGVDGDLTAIVKPISGINLSDAEEVTVSIKNNSVDPLTGFSLQLELDDETVATEPYVGTIASMETVSFTFAATLDLSEEGTYTVKVTAIIEDDEDLANNSKTKVVTNDICDIYNTPFFEDFSSTTFPPRCWRVFDIDGDGTQWQRSTSRYYSPPASAVHSYDDGDQIGWLVTPAIHLSEEGAIMSFWCYSYYPQYVDYNGVWVSTGSSDPLSGDFVEIKQLAGDE